MVDGNARFSALFENAAPALFAWATVRIHGPLRSRCDPEDIVQEICCRAYARFSTFDPSKGEFRGWVFGIANNVLREALSELASRPPGTLATFSGSRNAWNDLSDDATAVSQRVTRNEALRTFVATLSNLPEPDQRLLIFRGCEGLSHARVAELLGIDRKAAEKRWERLLGRLRKGGAPDGMFLP